ncbi:zinc-binding dehydrogenase, partial [Mesorhizobium sp.]|uniref:zinc-binding dehydrogenase n=1 Tax=Mesorhizobium sp. TaxID=1871066 RepID=UPI000FE5E7D3
KPIQSPSPKSHNPCAEPLVPLLSPAVLKTSLSELFELAISGRLTVAIGGRFRLEQAAEAHRLLEERRSTGKVVLIP